MNRLIEIFNGEEVIRLDEPDLPLQIGAHATADIRLEGDFGIAAYLGEDRNYLFLQPADNDVAIFHNDERVTRSVWVKSEDTTRIGTALIHWQLSGQRVAARITTSAEPRLQPPAELPDQPPADKSADIPSPLPDADESSAFSRHRRAIFVGLFALLLVSAAFVLLAKPMAVTVTPLPDNIDITGFPPVMKYGDRYLGIIGNYLLQAEKEGIRNFSLFCNHITTVPTIKAILDSPDMKIDGFLAPGHVSMVIGARPFDFVARDYNRPIVITGFEPLDILQSIWMLLRQIAEGRCEVENQYSRVVPPAGNRAALEAISKVFEIREFFEWRGLGSIDHSGVRIREAYADFDAEQKFPVPKW